MQEESLQGEAGEAAREPGGAWGSLEETQREAKGAPRGGCRGGLGAIAGPARLRHPSLPCPPLLRACGARGVGTPRTARGSRPRRSGGGWLGPGSDRTGKPRFSSSAQARIPPGGESASRSWSEQPQSPRCPPRSVVQTRIGFNDQTPRRGKWTVTCFKFVINVYIRGDLGFPEG